MAIYAFYVADVGWRKGWRDKVVRWATGHPASHVEYVIGGKLMAANRAISASKRDGNKVREKLIEWVPDHWVFVEIDDRFCPAPDPYIRMKYYVGKDYDIWGAVATVCGLAREHGDKWFCSELMAHGMDMSKPYRFTPGAFYNALIYMGGREVSLP